VPFKNLALDREIIKDAILSYDENLIVSELPSPEKQLNFDVNFDGQTKARLIIYLKDKGKTTIVASSGSNTDLSSKVASHIKAQCQIAIASNDTFRINSLNKEGFDLLLEYLEDECGAVVSDKKVISGGEQYQLIGKQGDTVTVSYYTKGTFMIQGCPVMLHSQIIDFLSEILDLNELVDAQLTLTKTGVTSKEALDGLEAHLPNAYDYIENTLKAIMSPALALKKLEIELPDYSIMAFPVLKGLEGFIKQLFLHKGIVVGNKGFGPLLQLNGHNTVNNETRSRIDCDKTCTAIDKCYGYYKDNRHGLFHVDGIIGNTLLITDREVADSIVTDVLDLIESSYVEIIS
jgi:hypothetical protein